MPKRPPKEPGYTVHMPKVTLRVRVHMPFAYKLRTWLVVRLLKLAGSIGPHDVQVEVVTEADRQSPPMAPADWDNRKSA